MDRIDKELLKLNKKERGWVKTILEKIENGNFAGLDYKRLKGVHDIYRVRKGNVRIIYRSENNLIYILAIEKRNDNTYKNL